MNYLDLFHGIGGFSLGAYMAGMRFKKHYCSDIEKYCIELYKKRFPDSIQLGDISKIDFESLKDGNDWIITGGFPCQDISIAGKGAGIEGNRSGLWFEYWRSIRILRPRFAIIENVGAITIRGLDRVLSSLAEIGYNAEWQDIRAEDMGAPHRRERIWIVAYPINYTNRTDGNTKRKKETIQTEHKQARYTGMFSGTSKSKEVLANSSESGLSQSEKKKQQEQLLHAKRRNIQNGKQEELPNPIKKHDDNTGHGTGKICRKRQEETEIQGSFSNPSIERLEREKSEGQQPGKQGLFTECNNELSDSYKTRLQKKRAKQQTTRIAGKSTYKKQWSTEPAICSMVDGLPPGMDRYEGRLATKSYKRIDQLKGLGNAIVPQIAELLFLRIKDLKE